MTTATKNPPKSASKASKLNVRPLHDKIIVRRDEPESRTSTGIYLPESSKDKPKQGTVLSVGDGALNHDTGERIPLTIKAGDKVIFTSYAGTELKLNDEELLIMSEDEILAVID
ncbi:MAG: co-chaperone GroES [Phycisphaeraceae bacterium]|nr:co-chaperone GroES [Phycisphaeraceae bacterium]MCW5753784.1 co-chaperone GroES [Phycisphaeraceae bacterium]